MPVGESVAVNGCCLTVAARGASGKMTFDVVAETLRCTTLGSLQRGDRVNLEPPVAAGALLSGHIVQGHVDGVGRARAVDHAADSGVMIEIAPPSPLMDYVMPKGSITIDGVSLTVAAVNGESFRVALIPETLQRTTLARIGANPVGVNIEVDLIAKIVVWHLRRQREVSRG
jgi:riboflavin synthase